MRVLALINLLLCIEEPELTYVYVPEKKHNFIKTYTLLQAKAMWKTVTRRRPGWSYMKTVIGQTVSLCFVHLQL